jgi:hypothetical protein
MTKRFYLSCKTLLIPTEFASFNVTRQNNEYIKCFEAEDRKQFEQKRKILHFFVQADALEINRLRKCKCILL